MRLQSSEVKDESGLYVCRCKYYCHVCPRRRVSARLLLLGTYRGEETDNATTRLKSLRQDLLGHRLCQEIALQGPSEQDIADYLAAEFRGSELLGTLSSPGASPLSRQSIADG